jgi:hypothetical protein
MTTDDPVCLGCDVAYASRAISAWFSLWRPA